MKRETRRPNPKRARKVPVTFFAPAERQPIEVVQRQARRLRQVGLVQPLLNAGFHYLLLLNAHRQIVMASENILELVPGKSLDQLIGLRPGEALGCAHARDCESGCGTTLFCRQCGVVKVVLDGLAGQRHLEECHVTRTVRGKKETLHLRVLATPLVHEKQRYSLLAIEVISCR